MSCCDSIPSLFFDGCMWSLLLAADIPDSIFSRSSIKVFVIFIGLKGEDEVGFISKSPVSPSSSVRLQDVTNDKGRLQSTRTAC